MRARRLPFRRAAASAPRRPCRASRAPPRRWHRRQPRTDRRPMSHSARNAPSNVSPAPVASTASTGRAGMTSRRAPAATIVPAFPMVSATISHPSRQIEIADILRAFEPRELLCIVEPRQGDVGERHGSVDDRAGAVEGPQPKPQVGVVAHNGLAFAGVPDRREHRIRAAFRNCLTDARRVQNMRGFDLAKRQLIGAHEARRGAGARVGEDVSVLAIADEIHAGAPPLASRSPTSDRSARDPTASGNPRRTNPHPMR